jgi:hypothetical protein
MDFSFVIQSKDEFIHNLSKKDQQLRHKFWHILSAI